ncbi:MAG: hypothetical protein MUF87_13775 [Anaerolineae bacterium]|jgi:hypothetical protein|nr:hypothetical protein [Anaerolineae bacterium]
MTDTQLTAAITAFEAAFPSHPISYYHLHIGTAIPRDHTLIVVFPRPLNWEQRTAVEALIRAIKALIPLEITIELTDQFALQFTPHPALSHAAVLLQGPDIRDQIAPITVDAWYETHLHQTYRHAIIPFRPITPIRLPLEYPDPKAPFFGYANPDQPDLYRWAQAIRACAIALIATQYPRIMVGAIDVISHYREGIGGKTADWLEQVIVNAHRWQYHPPRKEWAAVRELCRDTLHFENEFMRLYQRVLLSQLWGADQARRDQALSVMLQHPLDDPDIRGAIHAQP